MSIDDNTIPPRTTVEDWRAVLHDLVDDVLDRVLRTAEAEWEREIDLDEDWWREDDEEPPGDPPAGDGPVTTLGAALEASLAAEIERGTGFWGCDGTLRCTRRWAGRILDRPGGLLDAYRRRGGTCDCAVLRHVLGRTGPAPRCPRGRDGDGAGSADSQDPGSGS